MNGGSIIKRATIKEIAKEANVSISTVSNALNDISIVNPKTKEKIKNIAERMNYSPDLRGKNLKAKNSRCIGVFLTNLAGPFYTQIINSIHSTCIQLNYEVNIYLSDNEKKLFANISSNMIDGAIVFNEHVNQSMIEKLKLFEIPIVFLDREVQSDKISSVLFDSYNAGVLVANYVLKLGCKNIAYIEGVNYSYDNIQRKCGIDETLLKSNISIYSDYIIKGMYREDTSEREVKKFLQKKHKLPDVFICANDLSSIGCLKALQHKNISVPKDVFIIGFDDIPTCKLYNPKLSSVKNQVELQGVTSVLKIVKMITNKEEKGAIIKLKSTLKIRESCC